MWVKLSTIRADGGARRISSTTEPGGTLNRVDGTLNRVGQDIHHPRGWWGETEIENSPVDCFPVEPTEPARRRRVWRDLEPVGLGHPKDAKRKQVWILPYLFSFSIMRMVGLEPTRCCHREILSLVRLPIPPHPRM